MLIHWSLLSLRLLFSFQAEHYPFLSKWQCSTFVSCCQPWTSITLSNHLGTQVAPAMALLQCNAIKIMRWIEEKGSRVQKTSRLTLPIVPSLPYDPSHYKSFPLFLSAFSFLCDVIQKPVFFFIDFGFVFARIKYKEWEAVKDLSCCE